MSEHRSEYAPLPACCDQVGRQLGLGEETVRRWALRADIAPGAGPAVNTEWGAEIERLKCENGRLAEDLRINEATRDLIRAFNAVN